MPTFSLKKWIKKVFMIRWVQNAENRLFTSRICPVFPSDSPLFFVATPNRTRDHDRYPFCIWEAPFPARIIRYTLCLKLSLKLSLKGCHQNRSRNWSRNCPWKMVFCYQNCSDLLWEKNCSNDWEKRLKFEAEGREFAKFLRSHICLLKFPWNYAWNCPWNCP